MLADRRTVAAPCKRTTVLQNDFVPNDVDLGLDDIETVEPSTLKLATEKEELDKVEHEEADSGTTPRSST